MGEVKAPPTEWQGLRFQWLNLLMASGVCDAGKVLATSASVRFPSVGKSGTFYATYDELARGIGGSRSKVNRALVSLKFHGFLIALDGGGGRSRGTTYALAFPRSSRAQTATSVVPLTTQDHRRDGRNWCESEPVPTTDTGPQPNRNRFDCGPRIKDIPETPLNERARSDNETKSRRRPPPPLTVVRLSSSIQAWRDWLERTGFCLEDLGPQVVRVPEREYRLPAEKPPLPGDLESADDARRYFELSAPPEAARAIAVAISGGDTQRTQIDRPQQGGCTEVGTDGSPLRKQATG